MEQSLLMTLMVLLLGDLFLAGEGFDISSTISSLGNGTAPQSSNTAGTNCTCPTSNPCQNFTQTITLPPVLARVRIFWKKGSQCEGQLYVSPPELPHVPLCFNSNISTKWLTEWCKDTKCGDFDSLKAILEDTKGYLINNNMTVSMSSCHGLLITCQDPLGRELTAYKAVTGILLFLILGAILLQFCQPTFKAIRKRFSQKRQNRWVGPTQSQSVSYHRGQAGGHPNNNTVKRQSYPGLEKLTVNPSREPSSNRNSDYDSYGYN